MERTLARCYRYAGGGGEAPPWFLTTCRLFPPPPRSGARDSDNNDNDHNDDDEEDKEKDDSREYRSCSDSETTNEINVEGAFLYLVRRYLEHKHDPNLSLRPMSPRDELRTRR